MGSSCCKPKEFQLSFVTLPNPQYQQEDSPYLIRQLLQDQVQTYSLNLQCFLQQSQTGNFIYNQQDSSNTLLLFSSNPLTGNFNIINGIKENQQHIIWKVLRKDQPQILRKGDHFKVGVQEFKVYDLIRQHREEYFSQQVKYLEEHCRYCFKNTFSQFDPLISLCKCSGSVKYVHLGCLRIWMDSKAEKSQNSVDLRWFKFEKPQCEICKATWPLTFNLHGREYQLYTFLPETQQLDVFSHAHTPYIVLESSGIDQNGHQSILFVRISLRVSCLIGSDYESCRLWLDFQGISPQHAMIIYCNNNFFLSDYDSNNGTLIKTKSLQYFSPFKGLLLLYKNLLMNIALKRSFFECQSAQSQSFIEITNQAQHSS